MSLKLCVDMMSQPCRALVIFMKMNKIPFEVQSVAIRKGEQRQELFLKLNPMGKVPVLVDGEFVLTESIAIFQYLVEKFPVSESFHPSDLMKRAKVNEYLEWQHTNTRHKAATVFIGEVLGFKSIDVSKAVGEMNIMLDNFEKMFLKDKLFIAGDTLTFADIIAACELIQPTVSGRDVFSGRPKMEAWMERVKQQTQPHFDDAHAILYKARQNVMKRSRM